MSEEYKSLGEQTQEDIDKVEDTGKDAYNLAKDIHDHISENKSGDDSDAETNSENHQRDSNSQEQAVSNEGNVEGTNGQIGADTSSTTGNANTDGALTTGSEETGSKTVGQVAGEAGEKAAEEIAEEAVKEGVKEGLEAASAEAIGAAAGSAAGPVGTLAGFGIGLIIDNIDKVLIFIGGILCFIVAFVAIVLNSWVPIIFNNSTLVWDNRRDTQLVDVSADANDTSNTFREAQTQEQLEDVYVVYQKVIKGVTTVSNGITRAINTVTGGDDNAQVVLGEDVPQAVEDSYNDSWDIAYLSAAYSVGSQMNQGDAIVVQYDGSGAGEDIINVALAEETGEYLDENRINKYSDYCMGFAGAWCQAFVAWCANQAGVSEDIVPQHSGGCRTVVNWYIARGQFFTSGFENMQTGDLIYYDWAGTHCSADHVGMIVKVENGYVYTIEGNTTKNGVCGYVASKVLPLSYIKSVGYGYARPAYEGSSATVIEEEEKVEDHSTIQDEEFLVENDDSDTYLNGVTMLAKLIKHSVCGVTRTYSVKENLGCEYPAYTQVTVKFMDSLGNISEKTLYKKQGMVQTYTAKTVPDVTPVSGVTVLGTEKEIEMTYLKVTALSQDELKQVAAQLNISDAKKKLSEGYVPSNTFWNDYIKDKYEGQKVKIYTTENSSDYYVGTGSTRTYSPNYGADTQKVRTVKGTKKAVALVAAGAIPEEKYTGDSLMNVTNAEYADYLREALVNTLNIPPDGIEGDFIWPENVHTTAEERANSITDLFGDREAPGAGASTYHQGIDIGVSNGVEIVAIADGVVTLCSYNGGYGNCVKIDHGDYGGKDITSLYAHASAFAPGLKVGDTVTKGQVIAYVGNTGTSYGNHIHMSILLDGVQTDPLTIYPASYIHGSTNASNYMYYTSDGRNYIEGLAPEPTVSSGNGTFNISTHRNEIYAIIQQEAGANYQEAMAVASCVANRAESPSFSQNDIWSVLTASGQFEGYFNGAYRRYLDSSGNFTGSELVKQACEDVFTNGKRSHSFCFFRASTPSSGWSQSSIDSWKANNPGYRIFTEGGNMYGYN